MVVELRPEDLLLPDLQLQECETIQGSAEAQTEELIARSGKLPEGSVHTLAVMHFQEKLEQLCWQQGNMRQTAPSQRMADFITGKSATTCPIPRTARDWFLRRFTSGCRNSSAAD